jgi:hypothetical protein
MSLRFNGLSDHPFWRWSRGWHRARGSAPRRPPLGIHSDRSSCGARDRWSSRGAMWRRAGWGLEFAFLALAFSAFACSGGSDIPSNGQLSGAGGSAAGTNGCATGYTECGSLCCAPGKVCTVPGRCDYPYSTAALYVYLCPSFNTGSCQASFLSIDQSCTPLHDPAPGTCYNTGFEVAANQSYGISSCTACAMGCGNPSSLTTPPGFTKPNYYSGMAFYCGTPCAAPAECGQAANAGAPAMLPDGSTPTGAGGGAGAGGGGAGGVVSTGAGGAGDLCSKVGATKECSQMIACPSCSFQSCSCFDGSNCSAGYHTSDGLDFPCDSCPDGCTAAAQAVVTHCGCAQSQ